MQRGTEVSIMIGPDELMNSRRTGSEVALADKVCARLADQRAPHVLIGGLGLGFTLRAALVRLAPEARVTVAELLPAVVQWARGPLAGLFDGSLDDARVHVAEVDVGDLIASADAAYDALILDVDNGPGGLVQAGNDRLYDDVGLAAARKALRPGGVLAVWSAGPNDAFVRRLRRAGFKVETIDAHSAGGRRGAKHVIWLATP